MLHTFLAENPHENPLHRRNRHHQFGVLAVGHRARARVVSAQSRADDEAPCAQRRARLARRYPRSRVGAGGAWAITPSMWWSTGSRSRPITSKPISICFAGRTGQYVFISSASVYQTPPANVPVVESTPLDNPVWLYSRNKIACEERLMRAYREEKFPMTVVRPSHTYDKTLCPFTAATR